MATNKDNSHVWGIRAGKNASANDLFMEKGVIALEDAGLQDLRKLKSTRDDFYKRYRALHPDETRTGSAGIAGKFFRFALQVSVGDTALYPCLIDKCVYIGTVVGEYEFVKSDAFPHQRNVKWKWVIPKAEFTIQARYELGAARTLFAFKKNVEELEEMVASGKVQRFKQSEAPINRKRVNT